MGIFFLKGGKIKLWIVSAKFSCWNYWVLSVGTQVTAVFCIKSTADVDFYTVRVCKLDCLCNTKIIVVFMIFWNLCTKFA